MDKFISISVGQGDAFYLERDGKKILIDGGRSRNGFANQFERVVGTQSVDVLVCTHADADHINGLLGFFDAGLSAREVWLPGSWISRLDKLLSSQQEFIQDLSREIEKLNLEVSNLEQLAYQYYKNEQSPPDNKQQEKPLEEILEDIERALSHQNIYESLRTSYMLWCFDENKFNLFIEAIDTAEKIRELAILSYHSGAKIRWFEFDDHKAPFGGEEYLKPVNCREILNVSKLSNPSVLLYLALSIANKESLVFYSPSPDHSYDVLFSADSDLSFNQNLPNIGRNSIITAPHHGSEHNSNAYLKLWAQHILTNQSLLVRSDGHFKSRPGKSYKSCIAKKACTLCRHPDTERQDIVFVSSQSGWKKGTGVVWCHCI